MHILTRGLLGACWLGVLLPHSALSASRTLKAGDVLGISADIVLAGDDILEVNGTQEKPCRIDANCQQIRTAADWRGRIQVRHCEFRGLGTAKVPALDLTAGGEGDQIVIEHSHFHACGAVHLSNGGDSATIFRGNTIHATSMVPVTNLPNESPPVFRATGS